MPTSSVLRALVSGVLGLALLAGCASSGPQGVDLPDISAWEARQQVLGSLQNWQFRGRIAVKSADDGFNARFDWSQAGAEFEARVGGPLGIGTVQLAGSDERFTLTDKDGQTLLLEDPEAELWRLYGWTIPVRTLRYWALGIPDPDTPAVTEFDDTGLLTRLEQNGWTVAISRYRDSGGQQMPRTLTATTTDSRVRMVIDRWVFLDH